MLIRHLKNRERISFIAYIESTLRTVLEMGKKQENIDQWRTGRCGFNTENAIFENFPPEVLNFAKMKVFS